MHAKQRLVRRAWYAFQTWFLRVMEGLRIFRGRSLPVSRLSVEHRANRMEAQNCAHCEGDAKQNYNEQPYRLTEGGQPNAAMNAISQIPAALLAR